MPSAGTVNVETWPSKPSGASDSPDPLGDGFGIFFASQMTVNAPEAFTWNAHWNGRRGRQPDTWDSALEADIKETGNNRRQQEKLSRTECVDESC